MFLKLLLVAASALMPADGAQISELWGDLERGAYDIGFTSLFVYDKSRPTLSDSAGVIPESPNGRQMQINIWYPAAAASTGQRMMVGDYAELLARQIEFGPRTAATRRNGIELFLRSRPAGIDKALLDKLVSTKLMAKRNAPGRAGRFPLVVFAHANPVTASVMSEYLASHGFVVASIASKGTREPEYRLNLADLETMTRDLEYTIRVARSMSFTSPSALAVIGMSNGSNAAVALAMRNPQVKAVISLDGTIGEGGAGYLTSRNSYYEVANMSAPVLHLYSPDNPFLDVSWLASLRYSSVTFARMPKMRHGDFLAYGSFERMVPGIAGPPHPEAPKAFEWVCRYTLEFIKSAIAGTAGPSSFTSIDAAAKSILGGQVSIDRVVGREPPPSETSLRRLYSSKGIDPVIALLTQRRSRDPQVMSSDAFNSFASWLNSSGQTTAAVRLLGVYREAYPKSARASNSLAGLLLRSGDTTAARKEYVRVLELVAADEELNPFTRRRIELGARQALGQLPASAKDSVR